MHLQMNRKLKRILAALFLFLISVPVTGVRAEETPAPPSLISPYAFVYDPETGREFIDKGADDRIYPASMTKMMTAILAIENLPDTSRKITLTTAMIGGFVSNNASVAGYLTGDSPTVLDLLYGTLLPSGADCANTLAIAVSGSTPEFVELMNRKAEELSMDHTHFTNPTGLHEDDQYSTCRDMAVLMAYCSENPLFREIINTPEYTGTAVVSHPRGIKLSSTVYYSMSRAVVGRHIDGFIGGKSGYTIPAGRCLASYAEINGMRIVSVTAQSNQELGPIRDANTICTWLRDNVERRTILEKDSILRTYKINNSAGRIEYTVLCPDDVFYDFFEGEEYVINDGLPEVLLAPCTAGMPLGEISVSLNSDTLYRHAFTVDRDIAESMRSALFRFVRENPAAVAVYSLFVVLVLLFIPLFIRSVLPQKRRKKQRG